MKFKCRFCDEKGVVDDAKMACSTCNLLYLLIEQSKPSTVEKIVREIGVDKFMRSKRR